MKKIRILVMSLLILSLGPIESLAYNHSGGKWETPSVLRYYIDQTALDVRIGGHITTGTLIWNISPYIGIVGRTDNKNNSQIRFYHSTTDDGNYAVEVTNPCHCYPYNNSVVTTRPSFILANDSVRDEVIAHEVGHSLGLAHENSNPAIMRQYGFNGSHIPLTDDFNGLAALYK